MSADEAGDHADAIVRLYLELIIAVQGERAEPLKVVGERQEAAAATSTNRP